MKLFVLSLALLAVPMTVDCQLSTADCGLPTADSLHATLDHHHDRLLMATLAEFDDASPDNWMNYVPSVGMGYTPAGEPRPTVSFSLAQLFTARRRKKELAAKRRSIEASAQLAREQAHRELDRMLQKHRLLTMELETMRQVFEIDRQLHELAVADCEAAKFSPMEFLPKEKAFLRERLGVERKEMETVVFETQILNFTHFSN